MAMAPLYKEFGIKRCIMSTYQAASGAGQPGMNELLDGASAVSGGGDWKKGEHEIFAHPLPFNVIPHIDKFLDDLYTKEERKVCYHVTIPASPLLSSRLPPPSFLNLTPHLSSSPPPCCL